MIIKGVIDAFSWMTFFEKFDSGTYDLKVNFEEEELVGRLDVRFGACHEIIKKIHRPSAPSS